MINNYTQLQNELNKLLYQILKTHIRDLIKNVAAVRSAHDPEAIHDLRVTTRRLCEAIKIFNKVIPIESKDIQKKLKNLFHVLGKKRDLDVFSAFIRAKVDKLPVRLNHRTDEAQKHIISVIHSRSYANFVILLEKLANEKMIKNKDILKQTLLRFQRVLKKIQKLASSIDSDANDKTLHKLRIAIKKLRYLCEFFEPFFNKNICTFSSLINQLKGIQDILGDHQDAITGLSMLSDYKKQLSAKEFEKIKKKYELKKKKTCKLFINAWQRG